ncbi:MAG: hypothetical protein ABI277_17485 [Burkholderiaceae bacterium]
MQRLVALIKPLRSDVASLDATIRMHDIGIDPDHLAPLKVQLVAIAKPAPRTASRGPSLLAFGTSPAAGRRRRRSPPSWRTLVILNDVLPSFIFWREPCVSSVSC